MSTIVATKELLDPSATSASPRSSSPEVTLSRSSPISYTISPPSTVTSSPILFYQQSLSTISSNDSIDTIKSSTSTIKLGNQQNQQQHPQLQGSKQESSSPQYNKPVSISAPTPVMAKESTLPRIAINVPSDTTLNTTLDAPKKTRKFNIPNYYVPPKTLAATLPSSSDSTDSTDSTNSLKSSNLATSELPPRLVRKKSGELVKSSLKLPTLLQRSISSPNIINDNNNNNTNSGFASPRKSVRFASRLINVKMFDGLESPASVSSRNSPCESPPNEYTFAPLHNRRARKMDDVEDLLFDEGEFYSSLPSLSPSSSLSSSSRKGYFDWGWNSSSDDEEKETEEQRQVVEYRLLRHNIPQNGYSKLGQGNVWLSSAYLLKQHNTVNNAFLCGFISVVNLAFEKRLSLKMTLDNWKSSCKLTGEKIISFVKSSGNIDEFKFSINLRDLMNMTGDEDEEKFSGTMKLQMCVMYEVNGAVYWANNSGRNYTFDIATTTTTTANTTTATSKAGLSSNNNSKNTIKSASKLTSTIGGRSPSPFEEVCSKLIQHQKSNKLGSGHGLDVLDSKLGGLSISNNFVDTKPTFLPASASAAAAANNNNNNNNTATTFGHGVTRPVINKSYSSNDIIGSNHRYSNRQRQKDNKYTPSPIGASSISTHGNGSFAGFSYTDLVNNFCFANNATTTSPATKSDTGAGASVGAGVGVQSTVGAIDIANGKKKQTQGNMGMSCSPVSTASTFQFFSDSSIHI
ncbi:hypothetical protein PVL30_005028 [Lodderomyces elongisporus]|uniref:uncharacterized protein n=1 Tax=Lodderomyces elongisporus TaxID=36914 RepID=UPI002922376B|nr:uncharacterized protein PVL30_005028 [Lodderomyces elongisporus]WLF81231.1 hypothetical protein PVL30_005028 [Lodderomyces elongisporus]